MTNSPTQASHIQEIVLRVLRELAVRRVLDSYTYSLSAQPGDPDYKPSIKADCCIAVFVATQEECWEWVHACRREGLWPTFRWVPMEQPELFVYETHCVVDVRRRLTARPAL